MVRKKGELSSTNSTIDNLLPPVPSVQQILAENLKYEEEMKKKEELKRKKRKKRKGSHTSTKYLPDWVNDLQCDWAHSHDFRDYAKHNTDTSYLQRNRPPRRKHSRNISIASNMSLISHNTDDEDINEIDTINNDIKIDNDINDTDNNNNNNNNNNNGTVIRRKLAPSETSPAFESPAQSPELSDNDNDNDILNNNNINTMNTPPIINNDISHHLLGYKSHSRNRSTSKESVGSDYGLNDEFDPLNLNSSLSQSESIQINNDFKQDLTHEVSQHLEKFSDGLINNKTHRKNRSDSMLPSELKKRFKTKIKEIGKSSLINLDDINIPPTIHDNNNQKQKPKKGNKLSRKWHRKRNKKKGNNNNKMNAKVIDEEHEIDNNYFGANNNNRNKNILTTPSREYSSSTSYDDGDNIVKAHSDNEIEMNDKIIKSDDEKELRELKETNAITKQPKKNKTSGGMFSRLFSKIQTWTDKNRQGFISYSAILKSAIGQQESLIKGYQTELHNCRQQMSSELKRWKRWAQIEAENMARTYYENKYLLLSSQIEIAMAKLQILQTIVNKVQFVLDGGDMEKVKHIIFEEENNIKSVFKYNNNKKNSYLSSPYGSPTSLQKKMNNSFSKLPPITSPIGGHGGDNDNDNDNDAENENIIEYTFKNPNDLQLASNIAGLQDALVTLIDVESKLRTQYESLIKTIMIQQTPSARGNVYRKLILSAYGEKYLIRSQNYHYHPPDDKGLQVEFNCLLIDDRYCEGKLLRKWRKDIQKKYQKTKYIVSAEDVGDFLQDITTLILREYPIYQRDDWDPKCLDDKDTTNLIDISKMHNYKMKYVDTYYVLKLYLDRLVFPRLSFQNQNSDDTNQNSDDKKIPIWISLYSEEEKEFDREFEMNCEWMRNLSQSQIGIPLNFQKRYGIKKSIRREFNSRFAIKNNMIHPQLPYYRAILSFNKAKNVYVPNDMLYCFIEGLRLINNCASQYKYKNDIIKYYLNENKNNELDTIDEIKQIDEFGQNINDNNIIPKNIKKENVQLSADDLFPILVYIIIHCRINDIYMRLGYLQKFLDDSIKFFGEVGMCLSLVQAAAEFIRKKEGWHFGLDNELDKNTLNIGIDIDTLNDENIINDLNHTNDDNKLTNVNETTDV